jgi:hypothetical protein
MSVLGLDWIGNHKCVVAVFGVEVDDENGNFFGRDDDDDDDDDVTKDWCCCWKITMF